MANQQSENNKKGMGDKDASIKPDPETLNTTDPQEHMEGPLSSLVQEAGENFDSERSPEEAKKKRKE